jgi:phosphopantothenoylcysteine decarboxylase/phosphopantothenate--cysteine ligase
LKNVVIGVTGGIAAYKALEVVSALKKLGIEVDVAMSASAQEFVRPLSFQSLSQNPVLTDMFMEPKTWEIAHISLAKKADVFAIVPATANIIGKIAGGIADDFITTSIMATEAKKLIAPAMNTKMFGNPIVQENIAKLKSLGYSFTMPGSGRLACGDVGEGKLANVQDIVDDILRLLYPKNDFQGKKVLVTAGGTVAPIDPVRLISNRSSGKMGISIAEAARDRGAEVTLVYGEVTVPLPTGVRLVEARTNSEMRDAALSVYDSMDYVIKAAAVSDFKVRNYSETKIKKTDGPLIIELEKDNDILREMGERKKQQVLVGFAAESHDIEKYAVDKLEKKNLDFIAANDISGGKVFGEDRNSLVLYSRDGKKTSFGELTKRETADRLLDEILKKE